MTKRDFDLIARVVRACYVDKRFGAYEVLTVAERFADELAQVNPRFDRARFLQACGVAS